MKFLSIIIFLFWIESAWAQPELISTEKGLSNRDVTCILQSKNGLMWFGTLSGLNRFDGYSMFEYQFRVGQKNTLSNGRIHSLCEDDLGRIWIGTADGINVLDQRTGEIRVLKNSAGNNPAEPNRVNILRKMTDQSILAGFSNGQVRIYKNTEEYQLIFTDKLLHFYSNGITSLQQGNGDTILAVVNHADIYMYANGRSRLIRISGKDSDKIIGAYPFRGCREILVADDYDGLTLFNTEKQAVVTDSIIARVNNAEKGLSAFQITGTGEMWAGYDNGEILKIELYGRKFTRFGHLIKPYLTGAPRFFFKDAMGLMWIGTNYGIIKFPSPGNSFEHYLTAHSSSSISEKISIRGMIEDEKGDIYIGSYNGLFRLAADGSIVHFPQIDHNGKTKSSYPVFRMMNDTAGFIWIGSEGIGFYRFNKKSGMFDYPGHSPENKPFLHYTYAILDNGDGTLLLGTKKGLRVYDKRKSVLLSFDGNTGSYDLNSAEVMDLARGPDGSIWVGTYNSGLYRYVPGKGVTMHFSTQKNNLSHNAITALYFDRDGQLCVGTRGGGLNIINTESSLVKCYSRQDGLPDNVVAGLIQDDSGNLWISTFHGLGMLNKGTGRISSYFQTDGLSDNEFNIAACLKCRNGKILMGGLNGINAFFPRELVMRATQRPLLCLSGYMQHIGSSNSIVERQVELGRFAEIEIAHDDKFISFRFFLADYLDPVKNIFSYKLEGIDESWNNLGVQNVLRFNSLPSGEYKLLVKASNSRGVESIDQLVLNLKVGQAFYRSGWFIACIALLILLALKVFMDYRLREQAKFHKLRTKISSDLHDEVGGLLTRLSVQSELISQGIYNEKENKQELARLADISRQTTASMNDVLWSIDARNDKMGNVVDHLREHILETLTPLSITVDFKVSQLDMSLEIDPFVRQNIFLIFKEAVNNIAKHSGANKATVVLERFDRDFRMFIRDNGKGFDYNEMSEQGQGLRNLKMRAENLKAQLSHSSENGVEIALVIRSFF